VSLIDPDRLRSLSESLEGSTAQEILMWAWEHLGPRVSMGTAFGSTGIVLLDLEQQAVPEMPVFFVDTGYQFDETLELKARTEAYHGIRIEALYPRRTVGQQDREHGPDLYERDPDRCCWMRKVEPLQRKLHELDGWVTSLRRDQSEARRTIGTLELYHTDDERPLVKVNPMARWTRKAVWDHILERQLPYNPLMDRGYPSIGCRPCTRAVGSGETDERAGRWSGRAKTECGIHTFMSPTRSAEVGDREVKLEQSID
jgi:phosphoadenosine phosphosulfate reductase